MIKLGDRGKDSITGYEGIAIARSEYLYGCVSIQVQSREIKDGKMQSVWLDEQRLTGDPVATSGGPQPTPPARSVPGR